MKRIAMLVAVIAVLTSAPAFGCVKCSALFQCESADSSAGCRCLPDPCTGCGVCEGTTGRCVIGCTDVAGSGDGLTDDLTPNVVTRAEYEKAILEKTHASSMAELQKAWSGWLSDSQTAEEEALPYARNISTLIAAERYVMIESPRACNPTNFRQGSFSLVDFKHPTKGDPFVVWSADIDVAKGEIVYTVNDATDKTQPDKLVINSKSGTWTVYKTYGIMQSLVATGSLAKANP
jgi:hypothetical protein